MTRIKKAKYFFLTDRFINFAADLTQVVIMAIEVSKKYLSTFNRQISQQLYKELRRDYAFPRAVCRSLSDLFRTYLDLYFGSQRKEGQVIFHAVSKDVPPGIPVEEMHLVPVKLTLYEPEDCTFKTQSELLDHQPLRYPYRHFKKQNKNALTQP